VAFDELLILMEYGTIHRINQSLGGLVDNVVISGSRGDEPRISIQSAHVGNPGQLTRHIDDVRKTTATGTGSGLNTEDCVLPCLAEVLERYCTRTVRTGQFILATANELGSEALDLDTIPRCSETELAHPKCQLNHPDKSARIRWVRGLSLFDGRPVYLPVVMVYLTDVCGPEEQFWFQISTGCAAHTSFEDALLSAILEVIERDSISVLWLQKLGLPRIDIDRIPASLAPYWDRYRASSEELEYYFFNATTDLQVPVIYGLQQAHQHRRLTTLVSCSAALDPVEALIKVMRDMAACRLGSHVARSIPDSWDDFTTIFHGAGYMARSEQAHAFDFLVDLPNRQPLSKMRGISIKHQDGGKEALRAVLHILQQKQLEAYAVDLTTDEALRCGVRVVRVIVPGLQPVGFQYRSRYLGHSRLYEAPQRMGYKVHSEEELNPWPQPFA
jgi:ribosomal protein S12 methylthiotransferase accessory factor